MLLAAQQCLAASTKGHDRFWMIVARPSGFTGLQDLSSFERISCRTTSGQRGLQSLPDMWHWFEDRIRRRIMMVGQDDVEALCCETPRK